MEDITSFKKYFNKYFWRQFKKVSVIIDIPKSEYKKNKLIENLYSEIINHTYTPSKIVSFIEKDKGNGVARMIPVFNIKDYCLYYYCIKKIEDKIAINRTSGTYGGWTLGGLFRRSEEEEAKKLTISKHEEVYVSGLSSVSVNPYSFSHATYSAAYGDFNYKLFLAANKGKNQSVAEIDIANFYGSIRLDMLEIKIREHVGKEYTDIVNLLLYFLNYWNVKNNLYSSQSVGIPQDAMGDCSRILANFYLHEYDSYIYDMCNKNNAEYFRYADDQFFFSDSNEKLEYLIFLASKKLSLIGLSLNHKKVKIQETSNLLKERSFEVFNILLDPSSKDNKVEVEKFVDKYIELLDSKGLANIKDNGNPLLNKALYCSALTEIEFSKKMKIISCLLDESYLKKANSSHFEKIYYLLEKKERKNFLSKLNSIANKVVHNYYLYELLAFYKNNSISTAGVVKRIQVISE